MYETHTPVEDRFAFSARGTFRCSYPAERLALIIAAVSTLFLIFAEYDICFRQYEWFVDNTYAPARASTTFGYIFMGMLTITLILCGVAVKLILSGIVYSYSADKTHFSVVSKKAAFRKTDIYYYDAVAVKYEEYYLFGKWLRGYTVTVITRSLGNVTFEYLFNKSIPDKTPENTPFHMIEERIDTVNDNAAKYGR